MQLTDYIDSISGGAADVISALNPPEQPRIPARHQPESAKWNLIIGIGAAALAVVVLVVAFARGK